MAKGIMGLFFGRGKNEQKKEEYQDYTEDDSVSEPRVMVCPACGAKNIVTSNSECEYCGSSLECDVDDINTAQQNLDLSDVSTTYTLTAGYYIVGVDIPVGVCNVIAISGSGNVFSYDHKINEVFGVDPEDVSSFEGLKLEKRITLRVSGNLNIKLEYKSIDEGFVGRIYDMSNIIQISAGNYIVGTDFDEGIYSIVAVSGSDNLYTGCAELNEIVGLEDGDVPE
ncbi:MAG: hypothetical protein K0S41_3508, partial [Anaerocolumna sp.]|nr:hypothetical protein [Anaerocolumna sp.]